MIAMLRRWTDRSARLSLGRPQPEVPAFVVGDIHGRIDLLEQLLQRRPDAAQQLVFLGDLVDRGEDSARVLERVKDLCDQSDATLCLRGNHEQMLLDFLEDPRGTGPRWLSCGGLQTLASFGVGGLSAHSNGDALEEAGHKLEAAMPADLVNWLRDLPLIWQSGTLAAVHAAADPEKPMEDQEEDSLLWGHGTFFDTPRTDGLWVVHGHTVVERPVFDQSRISIDTGAWYTGRLTGALVDPDGSVSFVSTTI